MNYGINENQSLNDSLTLSLAYELFVSGVSLLRKSSYNDGCENKDKQKRSPDNTTQIRHRDMPSASLGVASLQDYILQKLTT